MGEIFPSSLVFGLAAWGEMLPIYAYSALALKNENK